MGTTVYVLKDGSLISGCTITIYGDEKSCRAAWLDLVDGVKRNVYHDRKCFGTLILDEEETEGTHTCWFSVIDNVGKEQLNSVSYFKSKIQ